MWGEWSDESTECSQTCNGGTKKRIRQCNAPEPKYGGLNCAGLSEKSVSCNSDINCSKKLNRLKSFKFLSVKDGICL